MKNSYYLGFFYNDNGENLDLSVVLTTTELQPVNYFIQIPRTGDRYSGTITANDNVVVHLPSSIQVTHYSHRDYGVYLETTSNNVTVIGRSYTSHTTDTYLALPIVKFKSVTEYTYYAMSFYSPNSYSSILIVGTEDDTTFRIKFTYKRFYVYINYRQYYYHNSSTEYSFTIDRLQTMYIYSSYNNYDLTGARIISNKPVSVFSGHRCSYIPYSSGNCGYLIEQIPPTMLWGKVHYVAPLATRRTYTIKVLAAHYSTEILIYCNDTKRSYSLHEQGHAHVTLDSQEYCAVHSNKAIMVAQFSGYSGEDPSMGLISSSNNFDSKFRFSVSGFRYSSYSPSFINIVVMAQYYQPDKIYLIINGGKKSLDSKIWTPITVNGFVEAYATKVPVLPGVVEIVHANPAALMTTLVYGIANRIGYIHPGGPLYNTAGNKCVSITASNFIIMFWICKNPAYYHAHLVFQFEIIL